jgi:hypothetical protein
VTKRLSIYLMAGRDTPALAEAAVDGGADWLEIGFPFSDPLADGPVIRLAAEHALAVGMRTRACLECLAEIRSRVDVPLVPMTYASLLEAYGYERFEADAREAGATSFIVADLPIEAHPSSARAARRADDTDERIRARRRAHGRLALPRLAHRDDGRRAAVSEPARRARRARAARHRRAAPSRFRDLDAGAGGSGGRARRWHRRRKPRGRGGRIGGPVRTRALCQALRAAVDDLAPSRAG